MRLRLFSVFLDRWDAGSEGTGPRSLEPAACLAVAHVLSGGCPSLQPHLATTILHIFAMLATQPHLLQPVLNAVHGDRETVTTFFLDPSTDPSVIQLVQLYGQEPVLTPLVRAALAWVWCEHRARMRMLGLEHYLL